MLLLFCRRESEKYVTKHDCWKQSEGGQFSVSLRNLTLPASSKLSDGEWRRLLWLGSQIKILSRNDSFYPLAVTLLP